ncbi:hypothetical protein GCM10012279_40160 [Micromonospora yangpuensis]|nr:hypothetical protein GCM10012279_40160 [Micromonospora yangpuensis]
MHVVSAGVADPGVRRGVRLGLDVLDRIGIHIGPKEHGGSGEGAVNLQEEAGAGKSGTDPAERLKHPGQQPGCRVLGKPQLGMVMELTTQPYQLVNLVACQRHPLHPSLAACNPDLIETRT